MGFSNANKRPLLMGDKTALVYALAGLALSLTAAAVAVWQSRLHSFYAAEVYRLTARSHRRFAGLSAAVSGGFLLALRWSVITIPLMAIYVLALVLYASSFGRGFSSDDE